jgi:hypothetical protein
MLKALAAGCAVSVVVFVVSAIGLAYHYRGGFVSPYKLLYSLTFWAAEILAFGSTFYLVNR